MGEGDIRVDKKKTLFAGPPLPGSHVDTSSVNSLYAKNQLNRTAFRGRTTRIKFNIKLFIATSSKRANYSHMPVSSTDTYQLVKLLYLHGIWARLIHW